MSQNKTTTLVSNRKKIDELGEAISVYSDVILSVEDYGKTQALRDKLDYTLANLEIEGQEAKIKSMTKVLDIYKKTKASL